MLFAKTYVLSIIGLFLIFFGITLSYFVPFLMVVPLFILGPILIFFSIILIQMRAWNTSLIYLLDPDEKRDEKLWLYIWGDNDIEIIPGIRVGEKQSYNATLDQQAKTFVSYRFCGHTVYLIPDGSAHSVDWRAGLYMQVARDKWNVDSLTKLREMFKGTSNYPKAKLYDMKEGVPK